MHSEGSQRKRRIKTPGRTVFSLSMRPTTRTSTPNNSKISPPRSTFISREPLWGSFLPKPRSRMCQVYLTKGTRAGKGRRGPAHKRDGYSEGASSSFGRRGRNLMPSRNTSTASATTPSVTPNSSGVGQ